MGKHQALNIVAAVFTIFFLAMLAWLTLLDEEDPCAGASADIGAAVLADEPGDQEALVNRAIIVHKDCEATDQ